MYFRDETHEQAFNELLSQTEIESLDGLESAPSLLKRQIGFLYLIALYQQAFEQYEGMKFYVEVYEEMSLDGPVYLLDEQIGKPKHEHEHMIQFAKKILQGETIELMQVPEKMRRFVEVALEMIRDV